MNDLELEKKIAAIYKEVRMLTDANFMVQAWNSHDKLLEACKEANKLDSVDNGALYGAWKIQLLAQLEEAIAEAEKGESL